MIHHHGCEHARHAALRRYGVELVAADFTAMVHDIIATIAEGIPMALLLSRQPLSREIWLVRIPDGPVARVVYDPMLCVIIAFLPAICRLPGAE